MYYEYYNDGTHTYYGSTALYSEAEALASDLAVGIDWDRDNAKSLDAWFHGTTGNAAEQLYMALDGSASSGELIPTSSITGTSAQSIRKVAVL